MPPTALQAACGGCEAALRGEVASNEGALLVSNPEQNNKANFSLVCPQWHRLRVNRMTGFTCIATS